MSGTKKSIMGGMQFLGARKFKRLFKNTKGSVLNRELEPGRFLTSKLLKLQDLKHYPLVQQWLTKYEQQLLGEYTEEEIDHAIEWLMQYKKEDMLLTLGVEKVINSSKRWTRLLIQQATNLVEQDSDVEICVALENGYKIVKLLNENAYKYEGREMGHCVASYANKKTTVYSLRDQYNKPHATFEVNNQEIVQLQGKQNNAIKSVYAIYVLEGLKKLDLKLNANYLSKIGFSEVAEDVYNRLKSFYGENIPIVTLENKLYINHNDKYWAE